MQTNLLYGDPPLTLRSKDDGDLLASVFNGDPELRDSLLRRVRKPTGSFMAGPIDGDKYGLPAWFTRYESLMIRFAEEHTDRRGDLASQRQQIIEGIPMGVVLDERFARRLVAQRIDEEVLPVCESVKVSLPDLNEAIVSIRDALKSECDKSTRLLLLSEANEKMLRCTIPPAITDKPPGANQRTAAQVRVFARMKTVLGKVPKVGDATLRSAIEKSQWNGESLHLIKNVADLNYDQQGTFSKREVARFLAACNKEK